MKVAIVLIILLVIVLLSRKTCEHFDSQGHHVAWLRESGNDSIPVDTARARLNNAKGLSNYDYFYENQAWNQSQNISENEIHSQTLKQDWNLPINKIQAIEKI